MKTYYRGYRRAGIAKVHVRRETEMAVYRNSRPPGDNGWCGTYLRSVQNSPLIEVDPTQPLEDGLEWCEKCLAGELMYLMSADQMVALILKTEEEQGGK